MTIVTCFKGEVMPEESPEEEMEKRGVACNCADHPDQDPEEMTKTADGCEECIHCGRKKSLDKKAEKE